MNYRETAAGPAFYGSLQPREVCMNTFFFFQAEDGIRDYKVTGVQTCALPICSRAAAQSSNRCSFDFASEKRPCSAIQSRVHLTSRASWLTASDRLGGSSPSRMGIGKASCRGKGENSVGAGLFKKKKTDKKIVK